MHQQSRHPPRGSSPATSPQTNPTRTNNPRDALASRSRAASEAAPPGPSLETGTGTGSGTWTGADGGPLATTAAAPTAAPAAVGGPTRESIKKLDQIIQNFYLKAAVLVVQARIPVTPSGGSRGKKTNKWFQIETDDIEDFKDELRMWKHCGSFDNRPPPMVIETYLDASRLTAGQALVVIDENGKRWDALEALNSSDLSASGSGSSSGGGGSSGGRPDTNAMRTRSTEIILERWKVELQCIPSLLKSDSAGSGDDGAEASGGGNNTTTRERGRAEEETSTSAEMGIDDFGPILPTIYKRSIVFFRSLFVTTRVLPAYRFSRQAMTKGAHPALKVRCRVLTGTEADARINARGFDNLRQPLLYDGGRDVVTDYMFGDLEVPIGRFSASVTYRNDCNFRVDDSESLLSSRFMGIDENYFRPSLPPSQRPDNVFVPSQQQQQQRQKQQQQQQQHLRQQQHQQQQQQQEQQAGQYHRRRESSAEIIGSLPLHQRSTRNATEPPYQPPPQQTYGSLSTFHGAGALGTSPISALKAVRPIGSDTSSPTNSIRRYSLEQRPSVDPPHSLPITAGHASAAGAGVSPASSASARPPVLRNLDGLGRRPSVSFQPFKAGSLSGSPRTVQDEIPLPSSPLSGSRPTSGLSALAQARNRNSLTAGMAASLRGAPVAGTSVGSPSSGAMAAGMMDPGQSSSPRPAGSSRYSSSFTHRRARSSFGGTSRNEDDQGSSGKQSLSSSVAQPGSGLLAEAGGATSSGSFQTDDDNIDEFLKALESKKTLQSFETSSRRNESARRTVAQLSRFQLMRDSNVALTESMNSSVQLLPRSLSSSSRQLPSAPGVSVASVGATSISPSTSSPIKSHSPHTPHTPHTPAIPSRLSAVIDYQGQPPHPHAGPGSRTRPMGSTPEEGGEGERVDNNDDDGNVGREGGGGTTAIDIPLSPQVLHSGGRRSSSAVQKTRALFVDDDSADLAAFGGQRSLSVGADDREPPSPGTLFRLEREGPDNASSGGVSAGESVGGAAAVAAVAAGAAATATAGPLVGGNGLQTAAAAILRPSSGGVLGTRTHPLIGGQDDNNFAATPASMPPGAAAAGATAVRPSTATGTSQRRRYLSRYQQHGTEARGSGGGSEGRPTPPQMSRGSISSSFVGRYSGSGRGSRSGSGGSGIGGHLAGAGTGGDGEADDEPLVFDLSELGRDPNRRSIDEARGAGSQSGHHHHHHHNSNLAPDSNAADPTDGYDARRRPW